jgi:hypothetical protein
VDNCCQMVGPKCPDHLRSSVREAYEVLAANLVQGIVFPEIITVPLKPEFSRAYEMGSGSAMGVEYRTALLFPENKGRMNGVALGISNDSNYQLDSEIRLFAIDSSKRQVELFSNAPLPETRARVRDRLRARKYSEPSLVELYNDGRIMVEGEPLGDRRDLNGEKLAHIVMERLGLPMSSKDKSMVELKEQAKQSALVGSVR